MPVGDWSLVEQALRLAPERYGDALVLLIDAQARARESGHVAHLVQALSAEARLALRRRPVEYVLDGLYEALRIAESSGDAEAHFQAYYAFARTWSDIRMPERALVAMQKAADSVGRAEAESRRGWLTLMASVTSQCGRFAEADALYARLLQHFEDRPDDVVHGTTLNNLASHLERSGRHAEGLVASEDAERMLRRAGPIDSGTCCALVATRMRMLVHLRRAPEALALMDRWFAQPPQGSPWACGLWLAAAEAHLALGDPARAEAENQKAMDMALRLSIPRTQEILEQAARISQCLGREAHALQLSERASEEAQRFNEMR